MQYHGVIQEGSKRARLLGFPTVNISYDGGISGIFVGRAFLEHETYKATIFADQQRKVLEAHLIGFSKESYSANVEISVLCKIRETVLYTNDEDLKIAIAADVEYTKDFFRRKRVMVFGTFDGVHEGHRDMFRQARELVDDPYLIVSIARDSVVTRIKRRQPRFEERTRREFILREWGVDEVVLGNEEGYVDHICEYKPDIIALGYDQVGEYVDLLEQDLRDLYTTIPIVRLEPFFPERYKSSLLTPSQKGVHLGVDYGTKHVGIALSNTDATLAFAHETVATKDAIVTIFDLVEEKKVVKVIVGSTANLSGVHNRVSDVAEVWIHALAQSLLVPVERVNEAYSSVEAARFAPKGEKHNDAAAAAIILQRYLDVRK